tara:strand:- start:140659 stop:141510 length:852 start_codon:yes stop_codon:yes gene_type:complete
MKKLILLITISFACFSIHAQKKTKVKGNKVIVTDTRTFDYFTRIELNDEIEIELKHGNSAKLEIEADENLHEVIESDISNGALVLSLNKRITSSKKLNLTLYVDDLDYIELNDESEIKGVDPFKFFGMELVLNNKSLLEIQFETQNLIVESNEKARGKFIVKADSVTVDAKESSKLEFDLNAEKLVVDAYGSSTSEFVGKVALLNVTANDNATFKGPNLVSTNATVIALNKSDTYINSKNELEITAKNKAEVYIFNKPTILVKLLADEATLFKRESMTLFERL